MVLWMVAALAAAGQRFEVENVEAALFDMTAAHNLRTDLNGDACALVKFEIASPNAKFQGNVVGDVRYDVGEYWVYVAPGTKELHVLHESLLPLKLYFPDYGIPSLAAKTTYVVTLMLPNTQPAPVTTSNKTRYVYPFRDEATGYWGLRNYIGEEILEPRYEEMDYIKRYDYFVVVENGKVGIINKMGHELLPCVYDRPIDNCPDFVAAAKDGRWGVVDYSNKPLVPFEYQEIKSLSCGDDLLLALRKNKKWALVSPDGFRQLTPFKYELISNQNSLFSNPVVDMKNMHPSKLIGVVENGKWGFLSEDGKVKIPAIYDHYEGYGEGDCPIFHNGYAIAEKGGSYGVIDESGNAVLPFTYYHIHTQLNDFPNVFIFASSDDGCDIYDAKIRKLTEKPYYSFEVCGDSMAIFCLENAAQGVLDLKTGKEVPNSRHDEVGFYGLGQNRIMVKKNNKWGCIDRNGKQIFDYKYDDAYSFSNGAARVKLDGKWGFVKLDGSVLIEPKFDDVTYFAKDRLAGVYKSGEGWALMNILGKNVTPHKYWIFDHTPDEYNGYYIRQVQSSKANKWGYINYRGQEIVPCEYSNDEAKRLLDIYLREHGHITD